MQPSLASLSTCCRAQRQRSDSSGLFTMPRCRSNALANSDRALPALRSDTMACRTCSYQEDLARCGLANAINSRAHASHAVLRRILNRLAFKDARVARLTGLPVLLGHYASVDWHLVAIVCKVECLYRCHAPSVYRRRPWSRQGYVQACC